MSPHERDDLDLAIDRVAARMVTAPGVGRPAARLVANLPERAPRPAWRAWAPHLAALSAAAALTVAGSLWWNRPAPTVELATAVNPAPPQVENLRVAPRENPREEPRVAPRENPRVELPPLAIPAVLTLDALISPSLELDPVSVAPLVVEALPTVDNLPFDQKE